MRERPILLRDHEVRAIIAGELTQLRRAVPKIPWKPGANPGFTRATPFCVNDQWRIAGGEEMTDSFRCPYGDHGDRLWGREAFALECCVDGGLPPHNDSRPVKWAPKDDFECVYPAWVQAHYRATDPAPDLCCESDRCRQCRENDMGPHWQSSVVMPRWASRITLEVCQVWLDKIQRISEADAIGAGVTFAERPAKAPRRAASESAPPLDVFASLWDSANGAGSWDSNPWAWAIYVKRT